MLNMVLGEESAFYLQFYSVSKCTLPNRELEVVGRCKYLGVWINRNGHPEEENICRIGPAENTFAEMKETLTSYQFEELEYLNVVCGRTNPMILWPYSFQKLR